MIYLLNNPITHLIFNYTVAYMLNFREIELLTVTLSALIIDLDHFFYFAYINKSVEIRSLYEKSRFDYQGHIPHPYILHFIEISVLMLIIGHYFNYFWFLVGFGFILHLVIDALTYFLIYKADNISWIYHLSFIFYFINNKNLEADQ